MANQSLIFEASGVILDAGVDATVVLFVKVSTTVTGAVTADPVVGDGDPVPNARVSVCCEGIVESVMLELPIPDAAAGLLPIVAVPWGTV